MGLSDGETLQFCVCVAILKQTPDSASVSSPTSGQILPKHLLHQAILCPGTPSDEPINRIAFCITDASHASSFEALGQKVGGNRSQSGRILLAPANFTPTEQGKLAPLVLELEYHQESLQAQGHTVWQRGGGTLAERSRQLAGNSVYEGHTPLDGAAMVKWMDIRSPRRPHEEDDSA